MIVKTTDVRPFPAFESEMQFIKPFYLKDDLEYLLDFNLIINSDICDPNDIGPFI